MTLGISNKHVRQKGQSLFGSDKAKGGKKHAATGMACIALA